MKHVMCFLKVYTNNQLNKHRTIVVRKSNCFCASGNMPPKGKSTAKAKAKAKEKAEAAAAAKATKKHKRKPTSAVEHVGDSENDEDGMFDKRMATTTMLNFLGYHSDPMKNKKGKLMGESTKALEATRCVRLLCCV